MSFDEFRRNLRRNNFLLLERKMEICTENPRGEQHCWHTGNNPQKGMFKFCCWCNTTEYIKPSEPPEHGRYLPLANVKVS